MKLWVKVLIVFLVLLCTAAIAGSIYQVGTLWQDKRDASIELSRHTKSESQRGAGIIDELLHQVMPIAEKLSNSLETGSIDKEDTVNRLQEMARVNPEAFCVGVAFAPYSYNKQKRIYSPRVQRTDVGLNPIDADAFFDYTVEDYIWYHRAISEGSHWSEPFYDPISNALVTQYTVPFFKKEDKTNQSKQPFGVVYVQYTLVDIDRNLSVLQLGQNGYYFILSQEGRILSHPIEDLVRQRAQIKNVMPELAKFCSQISHTPFVITEKDLLLCKDRAYFGFALIPSTKWQVAVVRPYKDVDIMVDNYVYRIIAVTASVTVTLVLFVLFTLFIFRLYTTRWLWVGSVVIAILFILGTGYIWGISITTPVQYESNIVALGASKQLYGKFSIKQLKSKYIKKAMHDSAPLPKFVPTGLYFKSIDLVGEKTLNITGYIWQKYSKYFPADLDKGIIFPEGVTATIDERPVYSGESDGKIVMTWNFAVKLLAKSDFKKYPLDQKQLRLRMWHKEFSKNVILVPDDESYDSLSSFALPGLDKNLTVPGWNIESSYFSYHPNSYNTNFGIGDFKVRSESPELYFTVLLKRKFIGPFISKVIPIVLISVLLFFVCLTVTMKSKENSHLGITGSQIVSIAVAFLFVISLRHISLRSALPVSDVFYLEYYYFSMYLMLLLVSINTMLFVWKIPIPILQYQDNIIMKISYWPFVSLFLFFFTVKVFI